jgi:drug/metabolite transporter (DMT)-like permease
MLWLATHPTRQIGHEQHPMAAFPRGDAPMTGRAQAGRASSEAPTIRRPRGNSRKAQGIQATLLSSVFLGLAPIFGKQAILWGLPPLAVVAVRTSLAAFLLICGVFIWKRQYLFIYPAGLIGCLLAGGINGLGSLLYYGALGRLNASLGQMLYALYPLFVAIWLRLDHQPLSRLTLLRLLLMLPAVALLTHSGGGAPDLVGVGMMLGAAALYGLHLPINQWVLYDMPAPTVTLYTLLAMSLVVVPAYWLLGGSDPLAPLRVASAPAWGALIALTLVTFFSRLTLFLGVKHLGGMQTAILGLSEMLVTVAVAQVWLGERFSATQWVGAAILVVLLGLVAFEKATPAQATRSGGWMEWLRLLRLPADLR